MYGNGYFGGYFGDGYFFPVGEPPDFPQDVGYFGGWYGHGYFGDYS